MAAIENSHAESASPAERMADHFSAWERRGRGWQLWDCPVELEPPFTPYFGWVSSTAPLNDDGRKHTLFSGFIDWLHNVGRRPPSVIDDSDGYEPMPELWTRPDPLVELQFSVPSTLDITTEATEHFLLSLGSSAFSFEIIGSVDRIRFQIACIAADAENIRQQFQIYFPGATIFAEPKALEAQWHTAEGRTTVIAELGLSREFMLPLSMPRSFGIDPLAGVVGVMTGVGGGEVAVFQVLFQPVSHPWAESILRSVSFPDGTPLFCGPRDVLKQAEIKISRPLYAVVLRIACKARTERAWSLAKALTDALAPLADPEGNELFPLDNEGNDADEHVEDVLQRRSRRSGMILNCDELVLLVHPPAPSIQSRKLRHLKTTRPAPSLVIHEGICLGKNDHAGAVTIPKLTAEQRARHMHVLGASGTGKSTFLLNMIVQDIERGEGLALLDPHGDLVDAVLERIPANRINDVVLMDPADEEYPVGFNILSAHSTVEKNLLASDLVSVFRRLSTSWGDQMNAVLANAILAFLESTRGGTLIDLRRFLVEASYRRDFLQTVTDPEVVYYWTKEFPLLAGRSPASILTRLDTFLRPKPIRYMVGQKNNGLDLGDVMDSGKILLARLSHGAIGEDNAYLLGTLLVSKLHQLAQSRQRQKESDRRFFWLYIDEVHHFATPSMAAILSGARKYRLGLVVAHQELHQLETAAPEVASALSNVYTRVCFRLGDRDAKQLESGFTGFEAKDLQNLGTGEAICRVERPEFSFNLSTIRPSKVDEMTAQSVRNEAIEHSRQTYATARSEVEAELLRSSGTDAATPHEKRVKEERGTGEAKEVPLPPVVPSEPAYTVIPVAEPLKRAARMAPAEPASLGRGGVEHKYLQHLIKRFAEGLGFRAEIEGEAMQGAADVALRKGTTSIACEISITTDQPHELGNIRKCLAAGFTHVVAISPDAKRLGKLKVAIEGGLQEAQRQRVQCLAPDDLLTFIRELAAKEIDDEQTVRGYKVRTSYRAVDDAEGADKRERISSVVAGALKRVRGRRK